MKTIADYTYRAASRANYAPIPDDDTIAEHCEDYLKQEGADLNSLAEAEVRRVFREYFRSAWEYAISGILVREHPEKVEGKRLEDVEGYDWMDVYPVVDDGLIVRHVVTATDWDLIEERQLNVEDYTYDEDLQAFLM